MSARLERPSSVLLVTLAGLVALAWLALWLWHGSPYGRYLHHAELGQLDLGDGRGAAATRAAVYIGGWVLMTAAMMLPTTFPLLQIFDRMTRQRADRFALLSLVIAGYLGAWLLFGIAAHVVDLALHEALESGGWLPANAWLFGAVPLLLAGGFQFTRLKYRCLDKCRAPLSFVVQHWHGGDARTQALRLGAHHGAFCVGCCWALMLLMFAVGTGSLGWMLALGAVMAIEKNAPWGRRISAPLGVALLLWGAAVLASHAMALPGNGLEAGPAEALICRVR
jgi:predicted metal-binding membrane protein